MTCNDGKCVNRGEKTTFVYTIVGYERFKATTVDLGGEILKYIAKARHRHELYSSNQY